MYNTQFTLTDQDIVQRIAEDYTFPVKNQYGCNDFYLSRDVGSIEEIATRVQIHDFVEQIAKSEQPAVKFEMTIHGKRCLGVTPIGEALYRIFLKQHRFRSLPNQHSSEYLNLWEETMHRINGSYTYFSGNPMQPVNDQLMIEAELMNASTTRLREGTRRKGFKLARDRRRTDAQRVCTATTKLVTRLLELHPAMFGVRFDLMYRQECAEDIKLMESAEHIQGLIKALYDDPRFGKPIGYFWTRKFLSEVGYRTTLFLLFDPNTTSIQIIDRTYVLQQWLASTKGAGLDYVLPDYFYNPAELLRYVECSKKTAHYLRLSPIAHYPHFGLSDLPSSQRLAERKQNLTSIFGNQGGFCWNLLEDPGKHLTGRFK